MRMNCAGCSDSTSFPLCFKPLTGHDGRVLAHSDLRNKNEKKIACLEHLLVDLAFSSEDNSNFAVTASALSIVRR